MATFILPADYQIRGDQLADEINAAIGTNLTIDDVAFYQPATVQILVPGGQEAATQAVIDAHIPQSIYTVVDQQQKTIADGLAGMDALPGWATFTAAEAEQWIDNNVTNLPTAIVALKAMAKAIVYLRNHSMAR